MTISFTCPSCEHRLKVKDELAGRKVKCPSCGGGVLVPDGEDEEEAAAPARPKRQARETDADEERPRKKKRKKKSNKGLIIGLAVGGAVLVAVTILVIVLNLPKSQPNKEPDKGPVAQQPVPNPVQPPPQPQPHPEERGVGIRATMDRQEVKNDMKNIGIFYNQYRTLNNRGPADVKSFVDYFRRDAPSIAKKFDDKLYDMFLVRNPDSNTVIAYEVPGESSGLHIVVFGDGHVDDISRQELQALWKKYNKK
jgi:hypothetical protein